MAAAKIANLTITGKIGPGFTVTSLVLANIRSIDFQIKNNTIAVTLDDNQVRIFDYQDTATVTYTISGVTATITVS